jgi:hypothetical protein
MGRDLDLSATATTSDDSEWIGELEMVKKVVSFEELLRCKKQAQWSE